MTILTIDFDIIMQPSINFYNDIITISKPMKNYVKDFSFIANLPADLWIYEYLTKLIIKAKDNNAPIHFIDSHEQAVPIIQKYPAADLINIDHHHDCGYDENRTPLIVKPGVGNWVRYCKEKKLIQKYTWVKNENSENNLPRVPKYIDEEIEFRKFTDKEMISADLVIICGSFEWIPPMYHPLFMVWKDIIDF